MIEGSEYCGSCNTHFPYCVDDDVWIATCKTCGRPNVLCDKCHILGLDGDCDGCEHCKKCAVMENEWMKGEIGKVYYVDPALFKTIDCGEEGWYKVVDFDTDGAYVLENIETKYKFSTYGEVIDYTKSSGK